MTERHVALVVEDDPQIAEIVKELVTSLDHDVVHASTLEEVRAAVAAGGYCYALLDMQIPRDADARPTVGCGETALRMIRKAAPARNAAGKHVLPILVVTGYSRDPDFVSKMHEMDADGFIAKPFGERLDAVLDKIRAALQRAEREEHGACAAGREPVAAVMTAGPSAAVVARWANTLVIDGVRNGRTNGVVLNGKRCELQDARFVAFLQLVVAHLRSPGSWVSGAKIGVPRNKWLPTRIRSAFEGAVGEGFAILEADRAGQFRLGPELVIERVEWGALAEHPDAGVRKIAGEAAAGAKRSPA